MMMPEPEGLYVEGLDKCVPSLKPYIVLEISLEVGMPTFLLLYLRAYATQQTT